MSSPPPPPLFPMPHRRQILIWTAVGMAGLLGLVIFHLWTPSGGASTSICLFRRVSGIPCPGCGMTRAFAHLAKGEWLEAARDHPFSFLLAVEAGFAWVLWGISLLRGAPLRSPRQDVLTAVVLGHVVLFTAFWIGRLVSGTLPG